MRQQAHLLYLASSREGHRWGRRAVVDLWTGAPFECLPDPNKIPHSIRTPHLPLPLMAPQRIRSKTCRIRHAGKIRTDPTASADCGDPCDPILSHRTSAAGSSVQHVTLTGGGGARLCRIRSSGIRGCAGSEAEWDPRLKGSKAEWDMEPWILLLAHCC